MRLFSQIIVIYLHYLYVKLTWVESVNVAMSILTKKILHFYSQFKNFLDFGLAKFS